MKKKAIIPFLLLLAIGFGLAGCGSAGSDAVQETSALADAKQADDTEETEVESVNDNPDLDAEDPEESAEDTTAADQDLTADSADSEDSENPIDSEAEGSDTEANEEEESAKLPAYEVTEYEETTVMYASGAVNVRQGPSTDFEIVGFLGRGQEITVTGQADTGWYEVLYREEKAFVSNKYLQNEKPEEEPAPEPAAEPAPEADNSPQEEAKPQPVIEVKNVAGVILVGDSRFVQMQSSVGANSCTWIAESGKGYNWFNENAVARIDSCVGKGSKILINLGVNDPGNINNYLALVNAKAAEWAGKGATVYYASVNPVWENPYVTEEQVENFNNQMRNGLSGNVRWIDSHTYLNSIGYRLVDGLHYSSETYQNLYAYYMSCM